jgi:hypothetical protein
LAVVASFLISWYTISFPISPNNDAYVYVRTAEIFLDEGFKAAVSYYTWAFYSILIAITARSIEIDLFLAAHLVNAVLFAILTFSYLSILKEISENRNTLILGALFLLSYPTLNEYRYDIIRDSGFLAFSILALWQFLVFKRCEKTINILWYCIALIIAFTFRFEALLYLIFTPVVILLDSTKSLRERGNQYLTFLGTMLSVFIVLAAFLKLLDISIIQNLIKAISIYTPFFDRVVSTDSEVLTVLSNTVFGEYAANYSKEHIILFMLAGLLAILVMKLVNGIGFPLLLVIMLGYSKKLLVVKRDLVPPLAAYLLINLVIILGFILVTRFLAGRYLLVICTIASLSVPIVISQWQKANQKKNAFFSSRLLIYVFFLYCFIDSYYSFGDRKKYLAEASTWLAANSKIESPLITNNRAIAYSSGKINHYDSISSSIEIGQYLGAESGTIIVVELSADSDAILQSDNIASMLSLLKSIPETGYPRIKIFTKN